mgnify:CR=1 FL=1|tara:strand:+ start:833 stop:1093 length:261 start_codon:yes stop_codon:yes gene_type:complete
MSKAKEQIIERANSEVSLAKRMEALEFASSFDGRYILSQALDVAIEKMEQETDLRYREPSNIEKMKYLKENLYNMYPLLKMSIPGL